ncbi:MAG: ABC transporter permease [Spirochaetales bacterium]|nr:ABC transporter permease [Spirochaetales bacterium]MBQ7644827.1 ABC transporter permease [Spirochaetales bacterium]
MKNTLLPGIRQSVKVFFSRGVVVIIATAIIVAFLFVAILAPIIAPYDPYEMHYDDPFAKPSGKYLLGTDNFGRDLLSRIIYGARITLIVSLLASTIAALIGILLGMIAGYYGGIVSEVIMRICDAQLSIPTLIFAMVLAFFINSNGNLASVAFIIGISMVPNYVRVVHGTTLSLKESDYVTASKQLGKKDFSILIRHILPNCFPSIIVIFTMNLGSAILMEANMSFLGVGITAPTPAWGCMVSTGYKYLITAPSVAIIPGIAVILIVVAFNIVGDSLRDSLDPKLKGKI